LALHRPIAISRRSRRFFVALPIAPFVLLILGIFAALAAF
jgi:hypothetical protein